MMIKTYRLIKDINLTTQVRVGDRVRTVSFTGGLRNTGEDVRRGWLTTDDEELQQALEGDSGFGRTFRLERTESPAEPAKKEAPALEPVAGVASKQEAIEWLAANKGVDGLKPTCRAEAVRNAGALHGVSFPDWK